MTFGSGSSDAKISAPLTRSPWASAWWRGLGTLSATVSAPVECKAEGASGFSLEIGPLPATVFAEGCLLWEGCTGCPSPCAGVEGRGGHPLPHPRRNRGWTEAGWSSCLSWWSWTALSSALQSGIRMAAGRALESQLVPPCQESSYRRRRSAPSCCPQSWTGTVAGVSTQESAP